MLERSLVRIFHSNGFAEGVGFLIDPGHVLTCTHVVASTLGLKTYPEMPPTGEISLDFPLLEPGQKLTARVVTWQIPENGQGDVAVLEITCSLPEQAVPARLIQSHTLWNHPFSTFGFPKDYPGGTWATGRILGTNTNGWLQIEATKQTGYFVQPGFSGGPVWDESLGGVVGMIIVADRDPAVRAAFMSPVGFLASVYSPLAEKIEQIIDSSTSAKNSHLLAIQQYKNAIQDETRQDILFEFSLDKLYIPLEGQELAKKKPEQDSSDSQTDKELPPEAHSSHPQADSSVQQHRKDEKELLTVPAQPLSLKLLEAAEKHPRLIVVGTAGTGKSTFLRHLAHQKAKDESISIPILVPLSKFAVELNRYDKVADKTEKLAQKLAIDIASPIQARRDALKKEIEAGNVLWLLDGFDEAIKKAHDPEELTKLIAGMVDSQDFVLTTRADEAKQHLNKFSHATQYEMRDLSQNDVEQFLKKWLGEPNEASEVLQSLANTPHMQVLVKKPLHLVLLATTRKENSEEHFPETRTQLYKKFMDNFLEKRLEVKRDGKGVLQLGSQRRDEARTAAMKGFYHLGWVLFHQEKNLNRNNSTTENQVDDHLMQKVIDQLIGEGVSQQDAEEILLFWQETGIQKSLHLSFWPYAVACKLYEDWQKNTDHTWQFLSSATPELPYASRLHHPDWKEPIIMMAALMDEGQVNDLIGRLLGKRDKEERYLHLNLRLAAAILGEIGVGKVKPEYEKQTINRLGQLLQNHTWKRAIIQFLVYAISIFLLHLFLPWWALGSIIFIWILGNLSGRDDESPPSDLFYFTGPFLLSFSNALILILTSIEFVLSWPLVLLKWQAVKAIERKYPSQPLLIPPKYIWEHWLFERISLSIGCVLVVFIFYKFFPLWVLGFIAILWLFDIGNWFLNHTDARSTLLQISRPVGRGIEKIHKYISTSLIKFFGLITFNTDIYLEALAHIGIPAIPQLKQLLKANSPYVRQAVIRILGQTRSPKATDILIQTLIYGSEIERVLSIEALKNNGDASAIPALVFAWKKRVQGHEGRKAIIQALMKIDKKVSLPIVANMVENYDQPYEILNPPELIENYVPPSYSLGPLSLEERVFHIYDKLSAIWDGFKNLPFFVVDRGKLTRLKSPTILFSDEFIEVTPYGWAMEEIKQIRDRDLIPALETLLEHNLWEVRYAAAISLSQMGESSAIPPLLSAFERIDYEYQDNIWDGLVAIGQSNISSLIDHISVDSENKRIIIGTLGRLKNPVAKPVLSEILNNDHYNEWDRTEVATALGEIGGLDVIAHLNKALLDGSRDVRFSAIKALGVIGRPAFSILMEALDNNDWWVREQAAIFLGQIGNEVSLNKLEEVRLNDSNKQVRNAAETAYRSISGIESKGEFTRHGGFTLLPAYKGLGGEGLSDEILKALGSLAVHTKLQSLKNDDEEVRKDAAVALGNIGDATAVEPLTLALEDNSKSVRIGAAGALGKIKSPKALKPLLKAIESPDFYVYGTDISDWFHVPALAALMDRGDVEPSTIESIFQALGKIGDVMAIDVLIEKGLNISWGTDQVIEELRKNREIAIPQLIKHLSTSNNDVTRIEIIEALGKIGDEKAIPKLVEFLTIDDKNINGKAAKALGKIGGIEVISPLFAAFKDERKTHLHPFVVTSLGQLAGPISDENLLQSIRKALWQRRFAHYKEQVFVAYEQVLTQLTILQVRHMPQELYSTLPIKAAFTFQPKYRTWLTLLLLAILTVLIELLAGMLAEEFGARLPRGGVGIVFLAFSILVLIGINHYLDRSTP